MSLSDGGQVGRPKLGLIIYWSDSPNQIMLMVGPNQDLQRRPKSTEKLSEAKEITKNYLVKQLINKPTHGCTWVSWPKLGSCVVCVDSST